MQQQKHHPSLNMALKKIIAWETVSERNNTHPHMMTNITWHRIRTFFRDQQPCQNNLRNRMYNIIPQTMLPMLSIHSMANRIYLSLESPPHLRQSLSWPNLRHEPTDTFFNTQSYGLGALRRAFSNQRIRKHCEICNMGRSISRYPNQP